MLIAHANAWPHLFPRQTDGPAPWVTVDASGVASTVTPAVSTVSGTTAIVDGAPADVTGTVRTVPYWDTTSTITDTPSPPKPTGEVAGAFAVCKNRAGKDAPFCSPQAGSKLFPGSRYYFTWDPEYFTPNASVIVAARYYNESTGEIGDEAFRSPKNLGTRGFWAYPIDSSLLRSPLISSQTIIVQIITDKAGLATRQDSPDSANNLTIAGPIVSITKESGPVAEQHFNMPTGPALYIGLPAIGGFILICVIGVCLWNRKHRKINLGNIMSRSRHGYGAGKSARSRLRMGTSRKFKEHIQLREREIMQQQSASRSPAGPPSPYYRDVSPPLPSPGRPRRDYNDDEDLGSLVGTPVEERKMNFDGGKAQTGGSSGNVFRDEMRRQNTERF
ncbi:uncharacterized protein B0I36DRAFT_368541 [Microdochium trichocladiopsis]|uniref:Uncharacterized protein n=1 Tax=Microdochium trichocladiopsis TaxID=1682393 RepID=A0A9P9BKH5_9PEZI|nr:uncharacterized protein B0I36DRAFT_368541 [Microdochium trichocladiopsis]KAH7018526.1 hypothetical protein B0I36DRAFT_368541 [Microdochium trichocladiopsis]